LLIPSEVTLDSQLTMSTRQRCVMINIYLRQGSAEIAGLDIVGLDIDGRMCGQLTELKLQNFIP